MKIIIIVLALLLSSCRTGFVILDEYEDASIYLNHFIVETIRTNGISWKRDTDINSDSLVSIIHNGMKKHASNVIQIKNGLNKMSLEVWKKKKDRVIFRHQKIAPDFIKSIGLKNQVSIIPFIRLEEIYSANEGGVLYYQQIHLSVFIVKNNCIIFSSFGWKGSKGKSYVDEEEERAIDKTSFFTQEDWDELVKEVMQPYIDRLK